MAVSRVLDRVGQVLGGRYRLLAPIGTGASASVYAAEDVVLRRRVALKVLHAALADDGAFLRRFRAEARAAAALNHPHVMAVYDWGQDTTQDRATIEGIPYLVMELLEGGSLRAVLDQGDRLTPSQALMVGLETARGLEYAHRRGFVHRDIKPANLLFDEDGRLRIADFGLARALAEAAWTEPMGAVLGTARYSSPEQARGESLDGKSDVFSLALVMIEAVTGVVPFTADTTIGTLMARVNQPLIVPEALAGLRGPLEWAGHPDPELRPGASEFGAALLAAATDFDRPAPLRLAGINHVDVWSRGLDPTAIGAPGSNEIDASAHSPIDLTDPGFDDGRFDEDSITVPAGDPAGAMFVDARPTADDDHADDGPTLVTVEDLRLEGDDLEEFPVAAGLESGAFVDGGFDDAGFATDGAGSPAFDDLDHPDRSVHAPGPPHRRKGRLRSSLPFTAPSSLAPAAAAWVGLAPVESDADPGDPGLAATGWAAGGAPTVVTEAPTDTTQTSRDAATGQTPATPGTPGGSSLAGHGREPSATATSILSSGAVAHGVSVDPPLAVTLEALPEPLADGYESMSGRDRRAVRKATVPPRRRWPVVLVAFVVLVAAAGGGYAQWYFNIRIPTFRVPALVGRSTADMDAAIAGHQWVVSTEDRFDDRASTGTILEQEPASGIDVPRGGSLRVVVSKGRPPVSVPVAMIGRSLAEATADLAAVGLALGPVERRFDEVAPTDTVIAVAPGTAAQVLKGDAVGLVVSDGPEPRTIPGGLVGQPADRVVATLKDLGLKASTTEEFSDSIATGNVISVDPATGTRAARDSTVRLVVSKGPPLVEVPDVAGQSVDDAAAALESAGFVVTSIKGSPRRKVVSTDPAAGTKVRPGSSIIISTTAAPTKED